METNSDILRIVQNYKTENRGPRATFERMLMSRFLYKLKTGELRTLGWLHAEGYVDSEDYCPWTKHYEDVEEDKDRLVT